MIVTFHRCELLMAGATLVLQPAKDLKITGAALGHNVKVDGAEGRTTVALRFITAEGEHQSAEICTLIPQKVCMGRR